MQDFFSVLASLLTVQSSLFYPAAVVEKISLEGRSVNLTLLKKHFFRIDLEDNGLVPFEERNKTLIEIEHFCYYQDVFAVQASLFDGIFISQAYLKAIQSSLSDLAVVQFEMFLKGRYHFIKKFS